MIPAEFREALDLKPGDDLIAWLDGDSLILRRRADVERELWAMFADEGGMTKELLRERRKEAARELQG